MVDPERPDDVHALVEREPARDDVLRELVGRDRRERDRRERSPLRGAGARASVARTRPARARRSMSRRERRRGGRARSPALRLSRVVDAERRPRVRLETLRRDLLAARRARAVGALLDALERRLDLRRAPAPSSRPACSRSRDSASPWRSRRAGRSSEQAPRPRRRATLDGPRGGARVRSARAHVPSAAALRKCSTSMLMHACPFFLDRSWLRSSGGAR